jgi:hypothetical protein
MLDKSKLISHKAPVWVERSAPVRRDRPINPHVPETDIDKSTPKRAEGSGLKGLMNNLPAKAGG